MIKGITGQEMCIKNNGERKYTTNDVHREVKPTTKKQ